MRVTRILGLLIALLLTGLPLGIGVAAAQEPTSMKLQVQLKKGWGIFADDVAPSHGALETAAYVATLTSEGTPLPDKPVQLLRMLQGETDWSVVDESVTNGDGQVYLADPVTRNATYRIVFAGDETHATAEKSQTVKAMRDLNEAYVDKGKTLIFKGDVNPGWEGKKVFLQKKTCKKCTFKTVKSVKASDSGAWKFKVGYPGRRGVTWYYRARIPKSEGFIESITEHVLKTYVIRPGHARAVVR